MAKNSAIEWTHHTFNPWWGCTKVSAACDHCYAETWARRTGHDVWGPRAPRRFPSERYWREPFAWNEAARKIGVKARVFCASMSDVFEWRSDLTPHRQRLWELIEATESLDWLLLTKRPHLVSRLAPWGSNWPENVWVGTTVESKREARKRIKPLLEIGSRIRFLSCEPLLEEVDLTPWLNKGRIDWVIAGGESGGNARKIKKDWVVSLRDQCEEAGVAFHFKQWGNWGEDGRRRSKKENGRSIDGKTHDEFPESIEHSNPKSLIASSRAA